MQIRILVWAIDDFFKFLFNFKLKVGIYIPLNSLDCRMGGNMHQARSSKEMQYME